MDILGIDIGGSSVKSGVVRVDQGGPLPPTDVRTVQLTSLEFSHLSRIVVELAAQAIEHGINGVGISTTGAVDRSGLVLNAGHFQGYRDVSWPDVLRANGLELPTAVINDGKAVALAEYAVNGPAECFVSLVVGTGIGGGILIGGHLLYGDNQWAGGLGHMKVPGVPLDIDCSCGRRGCVEMAASGPSIARSLGVDSFQVVASRTAEGDIAALQALQSAGTTLGLAIANILNALDPKVVTIGGGVVAATRPLTRAVGGPFVEAARKSAFANGFKGLEAKTEILASEADNESGMMGAAVLTYRLLHEV